MSARRTFHLLALSICGGAFLGGLSGVICFPPAGLVIGAMFGLVIGFLSFAIVGPALAGKDLASTALPMYLPATFVAALSGPLGPQVAVPATGAILALTGLLIHCRARNALEDQQNGRCRHCGYEMSATPSARCPECGTETAMSKPIRRWAPLNVAWLSAAFVGLTVITGVNLSPALERATVGYGTKDPARLMELMANPDMSTSHSAAVRLKRMGSAFLLQAIEHDNARTRGQAARMLRFDFDEDAEVFDALITALDDPDAHVRMEAAISLGYTRNPDAIGRLREVVDRDPSTMVVRNATEAIARLQESCPDGSVKVRSLSPPETPAQRKSRPQADGSFEHTLA